MSSSLSSSSISERHGVRKGPSSPLVIAGRTDTPQASAPEAQGVEETDEDSPLLPPGRDEEDGLLNGQQEDGEEDRLRNTKSIWYLILVTISIGGLQIAWSVELSNGSPYLLSLGLSKSLMALVWIAGPVTGTLVQPYVGMLSDNCRVSWGKRKPFMLGGAAATALSLLVLSWTKEIVTGILGLFGADPASQGVKITTIVVAVIWVYILDFAINTVQAAIRAFIVDCTPSHQQEAANSMASRIVGVGNIVGYVAGYADLPKYVWFLGHTQFQVLCSIAGIALCSTVVLSSIVVPERDPRRDGPPKRNTGLIQFFISIFHSIKRLPPQIRKVCTVQFCAWVGFFPMLFYTSSYIGEIYVQPILEKNPNLTPEELDRLYVEATRQGTFALLIFAIASLATNVLLPFFIQPTYDTHPVRNQAPRETSSTIKDYDSPKKHWSAYLVIPGFTLRRAWMFSHIIFAIAMFCTVLVRTIAAATALVGLVGITWALTLWAPWAIISAEISRRDVMLRAQKQQSDSIQIGESSDRLVDQERQLEPQGEVDQAGVILGIHNMSIASPQILATVGSSIVFRFLQKPRGVPGDHSIAVVLALGGFAVLIAAYFVSKIEDNMSLPQAVGDAPGGGNKVNGGGDNTDEPRTSSEQATVARNSTLVGLEY